MSVDIAMESDPLIGQQLGNYIVQRLIGRGGMARVYEGMDFKLGRRAAIKVMDVRPEQHKLMTDRFLQEARAVASLDHPNIVSVYEFGDEPVWYIAMKYLAGETLLSVLYRLRRQKNKYLSPSQVVMIASQIGEALDYAHKQRILHRDVKPSNIMVLENNRAILMDFGLAIQQGSQSTPGTTLGTPRYVAPEQVLSSQHAVPQTDIYSLGVVLYEMVTGRTPFDDDSPMTLALSHVNKMPPPPQTLRPEVPSAVQTVILKALEKQPENRWQTASALAEALRGAYQGIEPQVSLSHVPGALELVPSAREEDTVLLSEPLPEDALSLLSAAEPRQRRGGRQWLALLLLGMLCVGIAIYRTVWRSTPPDRVVLPPGPTPAPKIQLIYGPDAFTIYNATGGTVSLKGVSFIRNDTTSSPFAASKFGAQSHKSLAAGQCLRIVLRRAVEQPAPAACNGQARLLIFEDPTVLFWAVHGATDLTRSFRVERDDQVLQTCLMHLNTCEFTPS